MSRRVPSETIAAFGSAMPCSRRQVRRLADNAALLRFARADQIADDNQAGRNADAGLQGCGRF